MFAQPLKPRLHSLGEHRSRTHAAAMPRSITPPASVSSYKVHNSFDLLTYRDEEAMKAMKRTPIGMFRTNVSPSSVPPAATDVGSKLVSTEVKVRPTGRRDISPPRSIADLKSSGPTTGTLRSPERGAGEAPRFGMSRSIAPPNSISDHKSQMQGNGLLQQGTKDGSAKRSGGMARGITPPLSISSHTAKVPNDSYEAKYARDASEAMGSSRIVRDPLRRASPKPGRKKKGSPRDGGGASSRANGASSGSGATPELTPAQEAANKLAAEKAKAEEEAKKKAQAEVKAKAEAALKAKEEADVKAMKEAEEALKAKAAEEFKPTETPKAPEPPAAPAACQPHGSG